MRPGFTFLQTSGALTAVIQPNKGMSNKGGAVFPAFSRLCQLVSKNVGSFQFGSQMRCFHMETPKNLAEESH